jgi:hypothetical protein
VQCFGCVLDLQVEQGVTVAELRRHVPGQFQHDRAVDADDTGAAQMDQAQVNVGEAPGDCQADCAPDDRNPWALHLAGRVRFCDDRQAVNQVACRESVEMISVIRSK